MAELSMKDRMNAGLPYRSDGSTGTDSADAARATARYGQLVHTDPEAAQSLLRELLGSLGEEVTIRPPLHVDYGYNIHLGSRVFANFGLTVLDVVPVSIGNDVQFGPHVQILPPTHPLNPVDRRRAWEAGEAVTVQDNVWVGGGAILLGGVTVGHDSVVGAGAVVTKDIPPYSVAVGSPARVVRTIDPEERTGQFSLENFPHDYQDQIRREQDAADGTSEDGDARPPEGRA